MAAIEIYRKDEIPFFWWTGKSSFSRATANAYDFLFVADETNCIVKVQEYEMLRELVIQFIITGWGALCGNNVF